MLDKRKIDNLRDLLVGVVPNPIDQVKQITMALVYKFMNDMDSFNENFAGKKIYFVNDYAKYAWHSLMDEKLSNLERFHLYAESIQALELNSQIPEIFQHIFKGAFLSYRNPETLTLFLREINGFDYNADSEQLGDAFEYLLSILGSQKDAGQFRTPRHIIDFIVKIIKPTKHDTILDPACGTAGFLISAFQYIRDNEKLELSEFAKVFDNIYGYDITPDMVKIALINLYLHGDTDPHIYEYDTLSSEDRWGDKFSCILANPPFMTPKGGIKPHKKFRIDATKSEVLFVDYILEHLRISGRAGIIVPEGIIFQSGNAYKKLRKMLVDGENGDGNLIAVISLPSGVFKPYSGVKTSILVVDKQRAKTTDKILLVKINNDGFDLGDKRTSIAANDLPNAINTIEYYQKHGELDDANSYATNNVLLIEKSALADNDYNLSFDRYKSNDRDTQISSYPMVRIGDIAELIRGLTFSKKDQVEIFNNDCIKVATTKAAQSFGIVEDDLYNINKALIKNEKILLKNGDILISIANSLSLLGRVTYVNHLNYPMTFGAFMGCIRVSQKLLPQYLFYLLKSQSAIEYFQSNANTTTNISNLNFNVLADYRIPLPPLEIQQKIVAEIEQYKQIIDGAKLVVDNYKPKIIINPKWQKVKLSSVVTISNDKYNPLNATEDLPCVELDNISQGTGEILGSVLALKQKSIKNKFRVGDVLFGKLRPYLRKYAKPNFNGVCSSEIWVLRSDEKLLKHAFLFYFIQSNYFIDTANKTTGTKMPRADWSIVSECFIDIPTIEEQHIIVAELEHENQLVSSNKQLINIMQDKINQIMSQIWNT